MWVTIPCFNEATRLDRASVAALLADPRVGIVFVDDGSTDETAALLASLAEEHGERVEVVSLSQNSGKGEAVRRGMLHGLGLLQVAPPTSPRVRAVGYLDADFATPPEEFSRLLDVLEAHGEAAKVVLGARIARLGALVERTPARHYLGRIFATAASLVLDLAVYDTQCGAKVFRATPALDEALALPFRSRWAFDVELIGRLRAASAPIAIEEFVEVPLDVWRDKRGSKISGLAMMRAGADVLQLGASVAVRGKRGFFEER